MASRVDDHAAVAVAAEVLARVEAEKQPATPATAAARALPVGADGLGAVFDQRQPVLLADRSQARHVRALPEQVDRHDGARARRDRGLDRSRVDVEGVGLDIHEHRGGAAVRDRFGGADKGERAGDDLVARADPKGSQSEVQRVGAVGDRYGVADPAVLGDLPFQRD